MKLGQFEIDIVSDGTFWLDGGAMFGIVPKPLWEKLVEPDERNRIELGMNSLLVRTPDCCALVEVGFGRKLHAKKQGIYALSESTNLLSSLNAADMSPDEIDFVIPTHLHIDHAGWCTRRAAEGVSVPTFPRARYVFQADELADARDPAKLNVGSYSPEDFEPVAEAGQLMEVCGDAEVAPGIRVVRTGGHTFGHQIVFIESDGQRCVFVGDLIPTASHLKPAYGMAYDNFPLVVSEKKMRLLEQVEREGWLIAFPHEIQTPLARISRGDRGQFVACVP